MQVSDVAIVAHDAGGAEILSSWVIRNNLKCLFVVDGPAVKIFERKLGECRSIQLDEAIRSAEWVLCGSGWGSSLEKEAIVLSKAAGKKVVTYLDHWANYKDRFLVHDRYIFPDEIWVGDNYAHQIALKEFPNVPVRLNENPYLLDLVEQINQFHKSNSEKGEECDILYLSEPIKEHLLRSYGNENLWGYSEDDAIRYFLRHVSVLGIENKQDKYPPSSV
jgi:hypothetical protein